MTSVVLFWLLGWLLASDHLANLFLLFSEKTEETWLPLSNWQPYQVFRRSRPSATCCRWMNSASSWTAAGMRTSPWTSSMLWNGKYGIDLLIPSLCPYCWPTETSVWCPHFPPDMFIRSMLCSSPTRTPFTWEPFHTLWGNWVSTALSMPQFPSTRWVRCSCMIYTR